MTDDFNYDELDPNIREVVRWLRAEGFDTTDSGDGSKPQEDGCTIPEPHVFAVLERADHLIDEADRMHRVALRRLGEPAMTERGPSWMVQADYSPNDGIATVSLIGVTDSMITRTEIINEGEQ